MRSSDRFKVELYGYSENLINFVLAIFPPIVRKIYYKLTFNSFGRKVFIGEKCYFKYPWKIKIGDRVSIGMGAQFYPSYQFKDSFIIIEEGVLIAPNLTIFGAGHPLVNPTLSHVAGSVVLGRNSYIGGNVTIRYGTVIGESAVVAAGSVVIRDVEPFTLVGGNPAVFLKAIPRTAEGN